MDEAMQALSQRGARVPRASRITLASAGGSFLGKVNQGYMYVRTVPHGERTLTAERIWHGLIRGHPREAFTGNYSQREVMMALRQRFRKFPDLRTQVRNIAGFNIGGGTFDIDLALAAPSSRSSASTAPPSSRRPAPSAASWTPTPRSCSTSPSCGW